MSRLAPTSALGALALSTALSLPMAAAAQEFVVGVGVTDFSDPGSDSAILDLEYRFTPFVERRVYSLAFGANASVSEDGDIFVGAGLWNRWKWQNGVFIDGSIMPGIFEEGRSVNDLGSGFEIRSLIGVGYEFNNGNAVSLSASHKSNAGTSSSNPGAEVYAIRYHMSF